MVTNKMLRLVNDDLSCAIKKITKEEYKNTFTERSIAFMIFMTNKKFPKWFNFHIMSPQLYQLNTTNHHVYQLNML